MQSVTVRTFSVKHCETKLEIRDDLPTRSSPRSRIFTLSFISAAYKTVTNQPPASHAQEARSAEVPTMQRAGTMAHAPEGRAFVGFTILTYPGKIYEYWQPQTSLRLCQALTTT